MFGSIFRMRLLPGREKEVIALFEEWDRERKPKVKGAVAGYLFMPEKMAGTLIGVAVFQDRKSYFDNAADPEQDKWYRRLREHLEVVQASGG